MRRTPLVVRVGVPTARDDDGFLTDGERRRAAGIRAPDQRAAFVARRWFVREVIATAAGFGADDVAVLQHCRRCGGPHGRPDVILPDGAPLFASWSSAGTLTAVAVDRSPVGVDVVAGEDHRGWAHVEAVLKATGHGLDVDPALVGVTDGRVVRWDGPGRRPRLRITDHTTTDGHVCAVAQRSGAGWTLRRPSLLEVVRGR